MRVTFTFIAYRFLSLSCHRRFVAIAAIAATPRAMLRVTQSAEEARREERRVVRVYAISVCVYMKERERQRKESARGMVLDTGCQT